MVTEVRYYWYARPGRPLSRHKNVRLRKSVVVHTSGCGGRTRYASAHGAGRGSHQCLHWWQELSTGQFHCGILGFAAGLRCPISSLPTERLRQLSTAAPKCLSFICHRQRTSILPKASALLCSQDAADRTKHQNQKRIHLNEVDSFLVRMTGFEPAASCSQSKRSTKLSHIRVLVSVSVSQHRNGHGALYPIFYKKAIKI